MMFFTVIKFFKKKQAFILMVGLLGAFFGALLYFVLPVRYVAVGSMFVTRTINNNSSNQDYFDYEGYYAHETARSYVSTVIALLESPDIRFDVASDISLDPTKKNLTKLKRNLRVKKKGNQIIELSVYGDISNVSDTWQAYVNNVIEKNQTLNENGDANLYVVPVVAQPIIVAVFRNLFVNISLGFGFGVFASSFVLASKEYFIHV